MKLRMSHLTHQVHKNEGLNIYLHHHLLPDNFSRGSTRVCLPFAYCLGWPSLSEALCSSLGFISWVCLFWAQAIHAPLASGQLGWLQFQFCCLCLLTNLDTVKRRHPWLLGTKCGKWVIPRRGKIKWCGLKTTSNVVLLNVFTVYLPTFKVLLSDRDHYKQPLWIKTQLSWWMESLWA